jgi:hypothetical protein
MGRKSPLGFSLAPSLGFRSPTDHPVVGSSSGSRCDKRFRWNASRSAVPIDPSPATLFRLRAPAGLVRTVVNTRDFDLRQIAIDRLLAAADSPARTSPPCGPPSATPRTSSCSAPDSEYPNAGRRRADRRPGRRSARPLPGGRAVDPRLSQALVPSLQRGSIRGQFFFSSSASITMMPLGPRT